MILIGGKSYELVKEHRNAWNYEVFRDRYSDLLERFDYIVGDWGYNQLRLRGFLRDSHPKATKETAISGLQDYLNEYCNFGCAYFILEKTDGKNQDNPQDALPKSEEASADTDTLMSISEKDYKQFDRHKFVPRERNADKDRPHGEREGGRDNRQQDRKQGDRSAERERTPDTERTNDRNRGNDRDRSSDRDRRGERKERPGDQQRWSDRNRDRRPDRPKNGDQGKPQEGGGKPRGSDSK